jgi:arylsulfatase A-like enzyme
MLTSLYADTLGFDVAGSSLPEEPPTVAELMRSAGYRTVLWSQHPIYWASASLARGFDEAHLLKESRSRIRPPAGRLLSDDRPTFALVHLMPPHLPYTPPSPYRGRYSSWYRGTMDVGAESLGRYRLRRDRESLSEGDLRYVRDRYQENVAFADSLVARVLALPDLRRRYQDALVVLLSDHGEGFLEHGLFKHGRDVHVEMLHVPLIVKWPASLTGFRPRVTEPVSLLDLVPTLVDGLRLPYHGRGFQGRSLLPTVFAGRRERRSFFAVTRGVLLHKEFAPRPKLMFQSEGWRFLYDPLSERGRLYRCNRDPRERHDLVFEEPLPALLMRQALLMQATWDRRLSGTWRKTDEASELDPDMLRRLRALGYVD